MLFNSYPFLFLFLPVALAGYFLFGSRRPIWGAAFLAFMSVVFYAGWDYRYIPLLLGSVVFNYVAGISIARLQARRRKAATLLLAFAVAGDLALLGYYKYADFFLTSVNGAFGTDYGLLHIILPLGISFYTFTQIAFLADAHAGLVRDYRFVNYVLFVTYFPHLIAGPILHHREMIPQFADPNSYRASRENFEVGLTIFAIGLAKKVLIADSIAPHAASVFNNPGEPSLLVAWGGTLAYAFQLYFDFSGYCDMAIGLSRLFGIQLPINFNSPYKAVNIIDFWRRWHITLSRFLRDYLYIALGGNRKGTARRYANLLITMLLGGLWHGAGWTFVIWGALHGGFLVVNHAWHAMRHRLALPSFGRAGRATAVATTFGCVCLAWVYFRAPDIAAAHAILGGMVGLHGVALPDGIGRLLGPLKDLLGSWGVAYYLGGGQRFVETWAWIAVAGFIAFFLPNTQEILRSYRPGIGAEPLSSSATALERNLVWSPSARWAVATGLVACVAFLGLNRPAEFLYFQF